MYFSDVRGMYLSDVRGMYLSDVRGKALTVLTQLNRVELVSFV